LLVTKVSRLAVNNNLLQNIQDLFADTSLKPSLVAYALIVSRFCEKENIYGDLAKDEKDFLSKQIVPALVKQLRFQDDNSEFYNTKTLSNFLQIFEISDLSISERDTKILLDKIEEFYLKINDVDIKLLGMILRHASRFQNDTLITLCESKPIASIGPSQENDLALAFYGLHSFNNASSSKAIEILKQHFLDFDQKFCRESIPKIMYGLSGQDLEVCKPILSKISNLLSKLDSSLENFHISTIIYGLNGHDSKVCKPILEKLLVYIIDTKEDFSAQQLAMIFYGLKGQDLTVSGKIFEELSKKISHAKSEFSAQQLTMLAYGLNKIEPDSCKAFIKELPSLIDKVDSKFSAQNLAMLAYGLSGQDPEASSLVLRKLSALITEAQDDLTIQNLTMVVQGLLGKNKDDINIVINALKNKLGSFDQIDFSDQDSVSLNPFLRAVSLFLYKHPDQENNLKSLCENLKCICSEAGSEQSNFTENVAADVIRTYLKNQGLDSNVSQNTYIDGIEMDVYIYKLQLNIELDGDGHLSSPENDKLRDEYLQKRYKVRTLRIDLRNLGDSESSTYYADSVARKVISDIKAYDRF
jgi:very-short-patch-repair endonuclease